jgi:excinuclease UvrABC nuclease subunit
MDELRGTVDVSALMRPGVYLLSRMGEIVYVGQSKLPLRRIYQHTIAAKFKRTKSPWSNAPAIKFDHIEVMPCPEHQLNELERALIKLHNPRYNIQLRLNVEDMVKIALTNHPPNPQPTERLFKCRLLA